MAPITAPTNSFCKSGLDEDWRRIASHELVGRLPKPSIWGAPAPPRRASRARRGC